MDCSYELCLFLVSNATYNLKSECEEKLTYSVSHSLTQKWNDWWETSKFEPMKILIKTEKTQNDLWHEIILETVKEIKSKTNRLETIDVQEFASIYI